MLINNVQESFKILAEYYKIPINNRWSLSLWERIRKDINIKSSGVLRTWISQDKIPNHALQSLLALDLPDNLKEFYKKRIGEGSPLSLKEHEEIAIYLQNAYDHYLALSRLLSLHYRSKVFKNNINSIINHLVELRSALDSQVFKEYPDLDSETKAAIYYRKPTQLTKLIKTQAEFVAEETPAYEACKDSLDNWPEEIKNACRKMKKILQSDHPVIKPALLSNLAAFEYSVEKEKEQDDKIRDLENKFRRLEEFRKAE